jgi:hypothetical protein
VAKVKFSKTTIRIRILKILDMDYYFNDMNPQKPSRNFMLRYLNRDKVDTFMHRIDKNYDLLYNCESQYRLNFPTIDFKKTLWLYSIDNFIIKNRHNDEKEEFCIPEASKFVMATRN